MAKLVRSGLCYVEKISSTVLIESKLRYQSEEIYKPQSDIWAVALSHVHQQIHIHADTYSWVIHAKNV